MLSHLWKRVGQGQVGDCYFMAAIGAMAHRTPEVISNLFLVEANLVGVRFYPEVGAQPVVEWVPMTLDFGVAQAKLSGDRDIEGNYEVWPNMLEKAYRQWVGWDSLNAGGDPADVLVHLTGQPAATLYTDDFTNVQLRNMLEFLWNAGFKVTISTWSEDKRENWTIPGSNPPQTIASNHCYVIKDVTEVGLIIYNTWGQEYALITLPWDQLKAFLWRFSFQL